LLAGGLAAGLLGAIALSRIIASMLYGVGAVDVTVLAAAAACMIAITLLATGIPARRAMRVDPMVALRAD
jgi:ABC-type antimicrobial peptide transport system permease subunit